MSLTLETLMETVKTIGIANVIMIGTVLFFMGLFTGWVPSDLTERHDQIYKALQTNAVFITGSFYSDHASCLNNTESIIDDKARIRSKARCVLAYNQTIITLHNLDMPNVPAMIGANKDE